VLAIPCGSLGWYNLGGGAWGLDHNGCDRWLASESFILLSFNLLNSLTASAQKGGRLGFVSIARIPEELAVVAVDVFGMRDAVCLCLSHGESCAGCDAVLVASKGCTVVVEGRACSFELDVSGSRLLRRGVVCRDLQW